MRTRGRDWQMASCLPLPLIAPLPGLNCLSELMNTAWPDRGRDRGTRGVSHRKGPWERVAVPSVTALSWERIFLPELLPAPGRNFRQEFRGGVECGGAIRQGEKVIQAAGRPSPSLLDAAQRPGVRQTWGLALPPPLLAMTLGCPFTAEPSAPCAAEWGPVLLMSQDFRKNQIKAEVLSTGEKLPSKATLLFWEQRLIPPQIPYIIPKPSPGVCFC